MTYNVNLVFIMQKFKNTENGSIRRNPTEVKVYAAESNYFKKNENKNKYIFPKR